MGPPLFPQRPPFHKRPGAIADLVRKNPASRPLLARFGFVRASLVQFCRTKRTAAKELRAPMGLAFYALG